MDDLKANLDWSLEIADFSIHLLGAVLRFYELSALVLFVFVVAACVGATFIVQRRLRIAQSMDFFWSLLAGLTARDVMKRRAELLRRAARQEPEGELWARWDRTLVPSADGMTLQRAVDASHVFRMRNLAHNHLDQYWVAGASAVIVLSGVFGAAATLQLHFAAPGSPTAHADGVATAFATAFWGVVISLALQGSWLACERWLRLRLDELNVRITSLYEPLKGNHALLDLENESGASQEVSRTDIQSLVVSHIQATFDGLADGVQARIWDATMPALQRLEAASERVVAADADVPAPAPVAPVSRPTKNTDSSQHFKVVIAELLNLCGRLGTVAGALDEQLDKRQSDYGTLVERAEAIAASHARQHVPEPSNAATHAAPSLELLDALDTARFNIENTVDELQRRAQQANQSMDRLEESYRAYLDEVSDSATESGARMSNLLIDYTQQLTEQTKERVATLEQTSDAFARTVMEAVQALREAKDAKPPAKPSARRKQPAATRRPAAKKD